MVAVFTVQKKAHSSLLQGPRGGVEDLYMVQHRRQPKIEISLSIRWLNGVVYDMLQNRFEGGGRVKTNFFIHKRSLTLIAGALSIAFGGCSSGGGGGGGGIGGPGTPVFFTYPSSLLTATPADIGGFSAAYTLNTGTNILTSVAPGALGGSVVVTVNTPAAGDYSFAVSGITPDPDFSFTVPAASMASGATVAGATCAGGAACFRTVTTPVVASDGRTVTFTDLDVAATAADLHYSTMGLWSKPSTVAGTDVGSAFSFGVQTRGVDLPTTGTATYNGPLLGRYANGSEVFTVGATATATANFGTVAVGPVGPRSVAFSTSIPTTTSALGVTAAAPNLQLTGTFTYTPGTNQLISTSFTSAGGVMSGSARAMFYGPPSATTPFAPPELGGAFAVTDGGNQSMVGSFALKK